MAQKLASARRALWLSVIARTLDDYRGGKERAEYFDTRDFAKVCELAGVEPWEIKRIL